MNTRAKNFSVAFEFLHRLLRRRAPLRPPSLLSQHRCQSLVSLRPLGLFRFLHQILLRRAPLRPNPLLSHHRPRFPVSFRPLGLFRVLRRLPSHLRFLSLRRPQVSSAPWGSRLARSLPGPVKAPPRRRRPSPRPSCRVSLRIRPARTTTALFSIQGAGPVADASVARGMPGGNTPA